MKGTVPLYILGSSGHAREIAAYAHELNPRQPVFFVDDRQAGENCVPVSEYHKRLETGGGESIMGSGRCEIRRRMLYEIRPPFAVIIHPRAVVLSQVGPGCVVAPGAVVAPNVLMGPHVLINYNATIGHDSEVGALSVIAPTAGTGGWCKLGEAVYVGAGALIREKLVIGNDAVVAMGAVVTRDVPAGMLAVGMPARCKDKSSLGGGWFR